MIRSIAILVLGLMLAGASGAVDDVMESKASSMSADVLQANQFTPSDQFLESLGIQPSAALVAQSECCKICRAGKACGDTCISRDKICHVGPGCACDG
jgi:hypothetical protein